MPAVTILMHAGDTGCEIRKGIKSLLEERVVLFELLIAGNEDTKAIVRSFEDERIRFFTGSYKTPARFYNAALKQISSEFFATMDPTVIVFPGALERLLQEFEKGDDVAIAHSYFIRLDEEGKINRDKFRAQRERFLEIMGPDADYRKHLLKRGARLTGHFRIYRTDKVVQLGKFPDRRRFRIDQEIYRRVLSNGLRIYVVPEYLYSWRLERGPSLLRKALNGAIREVKNLPKLIRNFFRRIGRFLLQGFYHKIVLQLPPLPIPVTQNKNFATQKRIGYYIWHFPVLSQTFVNRELSALKNSGLSVRIIADEPEDPLLADENARSLAAHTRYLLPMNAREMAKYKRHFFFRNPFRYLHLFLFVLTHRFGPFKNLARDRMVFSKAVYLAGILEQEKINHIHSPWTDRCAFLSLLASKFLSTSYSVQSRAHEIHRAMYLFGLRENLENASFAITNSEYNRSYLQSLVRGESRDRIFRIYNGIDLRRFIPASTKESHPEKLYVLTVARLIEQKGLVYLLKACKILKDRNIPFQCEIVGGPEEQLFMNYALDLRKLHKKLELSGLVRFAGVLPFEKVLEKYKCADLFVLPSVIGKDGSRDITPNALIEAMAMKLPVISTAVTAIPEIVEHGITGLLVPPNDENALADAIVTLMESPGLRKELAENAHKKVEATFDITKNIRHYIELFSNRATQ